MLKKQQFLSLIRQGDFKELFITELGWNRYRGQSQLPVITVEETPYDFTTIAERSGFQIIYTEVDEIPTQSLAKKIDTKLRRQANDYICIYRKRNTTHDLWVVPVRTNEKRDLVLVEYNDGNAEVIFQKIDGITFDFDERSNIVDLRAKVQGAFVVNSEKITKDFYAGFKKQHKAFAELISGIDDHIEAKDNRNKQWYASVILNRLMFCYFIQKKGFLDLNTSYLRSKLEYVRANEGEDKFYNFYRSFLRRLFHDGLNDPKHSREFETVFGKIPYLNGGMFDEHQLEADYKDIDIPDEAFISLFDFFDKWNWHLDTRLTASGKDINPDVLGYIFEQYINDRAQMGAYYTKEDITEYIGRNCILPFLFDKVKRSTKDSHKEFEKDGFVWRTLRESGDRYIFDAVKKGYDKFSEIPAEIRRGIITEEMRKEYSETPIGKLPETHVPLAELRSEWNTRTPEPWGLPNEIWRETIERLQRCDAILGKIKSGEITSINDFITYNLDIRSFAADLLAKADNRFVGWFYHALQEVTVLDPTCGSGAFLFAAMNILEPLYEICIDRMYEFKRDKGVLFKEELAEITDKYRSNIQYFIYKSIILRNLYGVDIMVEATEIAKLRLFLKMVAVVDVDKRADNLGLDPLPDIDFNIRCGNTLVGYANKEQLYKDLNNHQGNIEVMEANDKFKEEILEEMQKVARAYEIFKDVQLRQAEDMAAFKNAKTELRARLVDLNDKLNHRLFMGTNGFTNNQGSAEANARVYRDWLASHQPFHWLSEFYQIIEGNGGFDVIIGNPPYVEYNKKDSKTKKAVSDIYRIKDYHTIDCGNLYAFVIERGKLITHSESLSGMIIPHSAICTDRMKSLCEVLYQRNLWCSTYDTRPSHLFDGVDQRLLIYIQSQQENRNNPTIYSTKYNRWNSNIREFLFKSLVYTQVSREESFTSIPKIGARVSFSILTKLHQVAHTLSEVVFNQTTSSYPLFYHNAPRYFLRFSENTPYFYSDALGETVSSHIKKLNFENKVTAKNVGCLLNSNLYYFWFVIQSNCRDLTNRDIYSFPIILVMNLEKLFDKLSLDYEMHSRRKETNYASTGKVIYDEYYPKLSKPIIDKIDTVLARHYGFSEEELDFIINYDIKYRMGDELNSGE